MSPPKLIAAGELHVVEGPNVQPRLRGMAREALPGEPQGHVIDLFRGLEVLPVACETICGEGTEGPPLIIRMATLTTEL